MLARWLKLHHTLGLLSCVGLLLWGLSGVMHPVMSRLQPRPAALLAPSPSILLHEAKALPEVLKQHRLEEASVHRIGLAQINSQAYYRIAIQDQQPARYFSMQDGAELHNGDALHAHALARHFTGKKEARIVSTEWVSEFNHEYLEINRLLPVWRVRFEGDDGLRAFVDTDQARLSALVNNTKQTLSEWFRVAHTWQFLDSYPKVRGIAMSLLLGLGFFSAASGLYFYWRMRKTARQRLAKKRLARWHRTVGLVVALTTLLFTSSGMFHLWTQIQHEQPPRVAPNRALSAAQISPASWQTMLSNLNAQPVKQLHWLALPNNEWVWLLNLATPPYAALTINANTGEPYPEGVLGLAKGLATGWSGLPPHQIRAAEHVTKFTSEYGFINKRLPVVRVAFDAPNTPRYYIEVSTASLATQVTEMDALEGVSFAYLHKWHFIGNKEVRDGLLALFALLNVLVALCGLVLFCRKH